MLEVRSCATGRLYRSGGGTVYRPGRHILIECDWIRAARRHTRRPDLFLYRHAITGKYMVCHWICRPGRGEGPGYFIELEDMDAHPDHYSGAARTSGRLALSYVRARLRPYDEMERNRERETSRLAWEEQMAEEETARERKDVAAHLERKKPWMAKTAAGIRSGELGFVGQREGGSLLQEIVEAMSTGAKGRVCIPAAR